MRISFRSILGVILVAWLAPIGFARAEAPVVILLSLDGVRHDDPDRSDTPALDRLAREGVRADRMIPVFPTNTFPNHVSMATGTYVDRHGIVGNRFWDPRRGTFDYHNDASWIEAEPIWVAAERQGVRSAVFFWVGSETDWRGIGATYRKAPFDGRVSEAKKVEQILAWIDLPAEQRPGLVLSWWHGVDSAGHRKGSTHPDVARQLARQDRFLARLLAGLDARKAWPYTTLLVVSDHGMATATGTIDVASALRAARIRARIIGGGGSAFVHLDDPRRVEQALVELGRVRGLTAYATNDLPRELRAAHPHRSGHLVLVAEPPSAIGRSREGRKLRDAIVSRVGASKGTHGYLPDRPEMAGIYYAMGRGIPAGERIASCRTIDVAPTVAALLGIEPPDSSEGERCLVIPTGVEPVSPG